ncbi:hypothetical protein EJB05_22704, partial [Eragrostis curvula]
MASSSASGALTKHGFPRGYRFVPECLEIVELLAGRLNGTPLPPPLTGIFHDIRILDHHPKDLYEAYKEHEEAGCIYFFSQQVYPPSGGGRTGGKKRRPRRSANGGGWKPSGGAKQLKRPRHKGGGVVGRMVTMVFYEKIRDDPPEFVKTNWGMHEFTVLIKPPDKFSEIAVYRLYKVKNGNKENRQAAAEGNEQQAVNAPDHGVAPPAVAADEQKPPTWTAAGYPGAGTSTSNQALVAASTSQDQKPLTIDQIHQHYHNQYAFVTAGMPGPSSWVPPGRHDYEHAGSHDAGDQLLPPAHGPVGASDRAATGREPRGAAGAHDGDERRLLRSVRGDESAVAHASRREPGAGAAYHLRHVVIATITRPDCRLRRDDGGGPAPARAAAAATRPR